MFKKWLKRETFEERTKTLCIINITLKDGQESISSKE